MRTIELNKINISSNGRNVKYDGKSLDKFGISSLIHDVAFESDKKVSFPLWSDIYWDTATKLELVDYLKYFLN